MQRKHGIKGTRPGVESLETRLVLGAVIAGPVVGDVWPDGVIPYVIDPSIKDSSGIIEAINEFNNQTNTQWLPRTNQPDYVDFTYTNVTGLNEAPVGDDHDGVQIAYLNTTGDPSALTAIALHEMGHTVGLWHEFSRSDRDEYVVPRPGVGAGFMGPAGGIDGDVKDVGPFDYASIMIGNYAQLLNKPDGTPVPVSTVLSPGDIATIDSLYPVPVGRAQIPGQVVAAGGADQILLAWNDTNVGQATYTVSRSTAGQPFAPVGTVEAGSTSYLDSSVFPGVVYEYMVTANPAAGFPAVSQIVYAATNHVAPSNLTAAVAPDAALGAGWDDITLTWSDQHGGLVHYDVEESIGGGYWVPLATSDPGSSSYVVRSISAAVLQNGTLSFRIQAQAGVRESLWTSDYSSVVTVGTTLGGSGGVGWTGIRPPPMAPPSVAGIASLVHSRKGLTSITIAFNEPVYPPTAENPGLYRVLAAVKKRRRVVYSRRVRIKGLRYDAGTHTVTINLQKPYKGAVQVSVQGEIEGTDGASANVTFSTIVRG